MKGDESGIDWRMETIDFSEGVTTRIVSYRKRKQARNAGWAGELWVRRESSRTAFSNSNRPCGLRGYCCFFRAALFFSHDMEHQAEGSQESSLGSI